MHTLTNDIFWKSFTCIKAKSTKKLEMTFLGPKKDLMKNSELWSFEGGNEGF